jgi:hypothetical protein
MRIALRVLASSVGLLASCDQALTIPDQVPAPLVQQLPLRVGWHFTDAFRAYRYQEKTPGDVQWDIEVGPASVAMFEKVGDRLFASSSRVDAAPEGQPVAGLDLVLQPSIEAFEFSLPSQSATEQYSVWIRYNVAVFGADGKPLHSWLVSAYGESGSRLLKGGESMQAATVMALRDAAALVTTGFASEEPIRALLTRTATPEATGDAEPTPP